MRESYEKGLANRSASNPTPAMVTSRVWHGQEVHAGQVFSSEKAPDHRRPDRHTPGSDGQPLHC